MISRGASAGARIPHVAPPPPPPSVPGLLMHFDGGFTDECRGRTFALLGGVAADAISATARFGSGALSAGAPMPIKSTSSTGDFDFQAGPFTIEFFIRRLSSAQVRGQLITYSEGDAGSRVIWEVRHTWGEGGSIPVFLHSTGSSLAYADNAAFYTVDAWDHIAIVSGDGASTLRMYHNGILVATRYRFAMPSTPSGMLTIHGNADALIDDLRVLPQEVYTGSSFTPPTSALTPTV